MYKIKNYIKFYPLVYIFNVKFNKRVRRNICQSFAPYYISSISNYSDQMMKYTYALRTNYR